METSSSGCVMRRSLNATNLDGYLENAGGILTDAIVWSYDFTVKDTHNYCLTGGINVSNSKRLGAMEIGALVGHDAFNFIQDAKLIRGQSNAQFWRSLRTGEIPVLPG